jgi:hypothetical protein
MKFYQFIDYANLRQQGIAWLEKLTDSDWTDFNAHDPGITVLEQLCYALTDLSYRINFDMVDLLSSEGADAYANLYPPKQILVTQPVTFLDLRKLAMDEVGVRNAWFESAPASGNTSANLPGLYQVFIEQVPEPNLAPNDLERNVAERLHANRNLATDYNAVTVLDYQDIAVQVSVEIDPTADPDPIYLAILSKIDAYVSPRVRFYSLAERLAQGKLIEEIFDGPLLDHGFIDNGELAQLTRKATLYSSVLIREIMAVDGVRVVEWVAFKDPTKLSTFSEKDFPLDTNKTPKLDTDNSTLILKKKQLQIQLDTTSLNTRFQHNQKSAEPPIQDASLPLPPGRDRHIARYYSILQQFPRLYGIGEAGLPTTVSEQRKAQAKQLKAYLLFFDQVLANSFSQLAHAKELFTFDNNTYSPTYFAANLDDPNVSELWVEPNPDARQARLQAIFRACAPTVDDDQAKAANAIAERQRKNRFADHLLARFAEQFHDYNNFNASIQPQGEQPGSNDKKTLLSSKLSLLRNYPEITGSINTGINLINDDGIPSGLERMLKIKIGVLSSEKLFVIEHILLRPISADSNEQNPPLIMDPDNRDPYSLRLTVVYGLSSERSNDAIKTFKCFAEQTVREVTPAHLKVFVVWLDPDPASAFDTVYQDWKTKQLAYRMINSNQQYILDATSSDASASIPLRVARDRVFELIGLGNKYPLQDLIVSYPDQVDSGQTATITISDNQKDVSYQLCDDNKTVISPPSSQTGNGGDLQITTPKIESAQSYFIKATKVASNLSCFLLAAPKITIKQVVAKAEFVTPHNLPLKDAQIVAHGAQVDAEADTAAEMPLSKPPAVKQGMLTRLANLFKKK